MQGAGGCNCVSASDWAGGASMNTCLHCGRSIHVRAFLDICEKCFLAGKPELDSRERSAVTKWNKKVKDCGTQAYTI